MCFFCTLGYLWRNINRKEPAFKDPFFYLCALYSFFLLLITIVGVNNTQVSWSHCFVFLLISLYCYLCSITFIFFLLHAASISVQQLQSFNVCSQALLIRFELKHIELATYTCTHNFLSPPPVLFMLFILCLAHYPPFLLTVHLNQFLITLFQILTHFFFFIYFLNS